MRGLPAAQPFIALNVSFLIQRTHTLDPKPSMNMLLSYGRIVDKVVIELIMTDRYSRP